MKYASINDLDNICSIFSKYKSVFPHIRYDYLKRKIIDQEVIFDREVVIIFTEYKRTVNLGSVKIPRTHIMLHQIANVNQGNGEAGRVLKIFCKTISYPIWLTVRSDNHRAIKFYLKNGFLKAGAIAWKNGTIKGTIFKKESLQR